MQGGFSSQFPFVLCDLFIVVVMCDKAHQLETIFQLNCSHLRIFSDPPPQKKKKKKNNHKKTTTTNKQETKKTQTNKQANKNNNKKQTTNKFSKTKQNTKNNKTKKQFPGQHSYFRKIAVNSDRPCIVFTVCTRSHIAATMQKQNKHQKPLKRLRYICCCMYFAGGFAKDDRDSEPGLGCCGCVLMGISIFILCIFFPFSLICSLKVSQYSRHYHRNILGFLVTR